MLFVIFTLSVYGLATAITILHVGKPIRFVADKIPGVCVLFRCPACASFWIGLLMSHFVLSPSRGMLGLGGWKSLVVDGLTACAVSYLLHSVTEHWDPTPPEEDDEEKPAPPTSSVA